MIQHHTTASGYRIRYGHQPGRAPGVLFCCGFRSDMESTKATALAEWCAAEGVAFTAFDYFGHGKSEGEFKDFTIGTAIEGAIEMLDHVATGPQLLVGSSMGGWVALKAARERRGQVCGIIGVAAAPDFTDRLMVGRMTPEQRRALVDEGVVYVYSDATQSEYPISQAFLDEAKTHLMLDDAIGLDIPVHLFHGQADMDVPWETALILSEKLTSDEVSITLIKDGDHRLNRPSDLALLMEAVGRMVEK